jgi:glycosyltransferase involved in cell wall biosynthesis
MYNKKNIIENKCEIIEFSYIILHNNSNEFIEQNIQSIISQTLNRFYNFEIIFINCNSNDDFLNILNKYKTIEKRIKIYNLNNSNIIKAKNFGIKKSNGKYLTFIDSNDYVDFDFFRFGYIKMINEKLDLYSSNLSYFCDETDDYEEYWYENEIKNISDVLNKLDYNIFGKIYKTDLIKNINFLSFDDDEIIENIFFNTIVFSKIKNAISVNNGKYYHKRILNCIYDINNNFLIKTFDKNNFDSMISELIEFWINDKNVNKKNHFLEMLINNIFINLNIKFDSSYKKKIKKFFKMFI